jgi:hypothetical protein
MAHDGVSNLQDWQFDAQQRFIFIQSWMTRSCSTEPQQLSQGVRNIQKIRSPSGKFGVSSAGPRRAPASTFVQVSKVSSSSI